MRAFPLFVFFFLLLPGVALAQAVAPVPTDLGVWPAVTFVACSAALWALRYFSKGGFLHTPAGVMVGSIASLVINAIQPIIASHGLDGRAILFAALGALGAAIGMSNPSGTPDEKKVKPSSIAAASSLVALVMIPLALASCAQPQPITTPNGDMGSNLQKFDAALAQCEKDENITAVTGPQGAQILQILETGGFSAQELEKKIETIALVGTSDEIAILASCAVYAYMQVYPIAPGVKPTESQQAARIYQARHLGTLKHTGPGVHR